MKFTAIYSGKIAVILGIVVFVGFTGCGDDGGSPASPTSSLDISGMYRYQGIVTPRSGDCSAVDPSISGTITFAKTGDDTWNITACTIDNQQTCVPYWWNVTVEDNLVTLSLDVDTSGVQITILLSGNVTDTSHFILPGQVTKEPGACRADGTMEFTRI